VKGNIKMKNARKVSAAFLGLGGTLLALIGMSVGGPARTVAAEETVAASETVAAAFNHRIDFQMVRSAGAIAANCIPNAHAAVRVASLGPVEAMTVDIGGLPPNREFEFFVIQNPDAPFGLAWYQGEIETDGQGEGHQLFVGRFNIETFIVAQPPAGQPAPVVHNSPPFPDASMNPATEPIHTYHLGLWFGSPSAAQAAGCPNTVTRFGGDHRAGIQALSTRQFAKLQGPLRRLTP
jgi:hypothetical protein